LLSVLMNYVDSWVSYYLPKTPEPPSPEPLQKMYISDLAQRALHRYRAGKSGAAAITAVSKAIAAAAAAAPAPPDDQESDDGDVELLPVRGSPRGPPARSLSPRGGSPRASPRASPRRAGPRSLARAPEAPSGRQLAETTTDMLPVRMRVPPRPQPPAPLIHDDDNDDNDDDDDDNNDDDNNDNNDNDDVDDDDDDAADRNAMLDTATARVIVRSNRTVYTCCRRLVINTLRPINVGTA